MTFGLQVFDSAGNTLLDTSDGVARLVGEYTTGAIGYNGSTFVLVPGMVADGNWIAFPLALSNGVYAVVASDGFTVYSKFEYVASTSWLILRKDGAITTSGFGFSAVNQNNGVQIDQDYTNYVRLGSGVNVTSGTVIPSVSGAKVYAVRPSIDGNTIWAAPVSAGVSNITTSVGTYDWIAYGPQNAVSLPPDGFGLRVYRADGSVAYDCNSSLLRPTTNISVPTDGSSVNRTLTDGPSGMRPYLSAAHLSPTQIAESGSPNIGLFIGPKITFNNNTSVAAQVDIVNSGPPYFSGPWMPNVQIQFFSDY